jgi:hypothetical protein
MRYGMIVLCDPHVLNCDAFGIVIPHGEPLAVRETTREHKRRDRTGVLRENLPGEDPLAIVRIFPRELYDANPVCDLRFYVCRVHLSFSFRSIMGEYNMMINITSMPITTPV